MLNMMASLTEPTRLHLSFYLDSVLKFEFNSPALLLHKSELTWFIIIFLSVREWA